MVLVWAEAIYGHFHGDKARRIAGELSHLWMISGLLLVATNFVFWSINGFNQWPHGAYVISGSIPIERNLAILLIYLFVSFVSFFFLFLSSLVGQRGIEINQEYVRSLVFFSFLVTLINLVNFLFLSIP